MAVIRRLTAGLAMAAAVFAAVAVVTPYVAAAANPDPITDYANYPDGLGFFADECTARGPDLLTGVSFASGGDTAASLAGLDAGPGDTVTMSWTGTADGCETTVVSLAVYRTHQAGFDPADNQELVAHGSHSVTIPDDVCDWQIDAVLGPPLAVVGPSGSYYNSNTRVANGKPAGSDMLVSSASGSTDCTPPPPPPPPPANPSATAAERCAPSEGIDVTLANTGGSTAPFVVEVDGQSVFAGDVAAGDSRVVPVDLAEDTTHAIKVTSGDTVVYDQSVTVDCVEVSPSETTRPAPAPAPQAEAADRVLGVQITRSAPQVAATGVDALPMAATGASCIGVGGVFVRTARSRRRRSGR